MLIVVPYKFTPNCANKHASLKVHRAGWIPGEECVEIWAGVTPGFSTQFNTLGQALIQSAKALGCSDAEFFTIGAAI